MLGNFLKIDQNVLCLQKTFKICLILMSNDTLIGKQVGSQASCRVTRQLAWIQPVCISIYAVPALKGLKIVILAGQQIRSKFDSFQNANFLISQPNPMMLPLIGIVSERRFQ